MDTFGDMTELLATVFENVIILHSLGRMFGYRYSGGRRYVFFGLALLLSTIYVSVLNEFYDFEGWLSLLTIIIFWAYTQFFTKEKNPIKLLIPVIAHSLIMGINIAVTYILSIVIGMPDTFIFTSNDGARLVALFLTKVLFFIALRAMVHIYRKERFELKKLELCIIMAMFLLTLTVSICLVKLKIDHSNKDQLIFIAILGVIVTNIFIIYLMKKNNKENNNQLRISMLESQLSEQKSMIKYAGNINQEIKKAEHDLRHHLLSLLGMIEESKDGEAISYLEQLLHEYETSIFKYVSIENSAVNSILNLKISRCHAHKIDIKLQVESDFCGFSDIDICVLIANLLDNAIEYSSKIETPQIFVAIRNQKNYLSILVKNRIENSVLDKNEHLKTTKADKGNHGLGLYSVSKIVEKYDGIKSYYEKKGYFVADIWLKHDTYPFENRLKTEANYQTRQI